MNKTLGESKDVPYGDYTHQSRASGFRVPDFKRRYKLMAPKKKKIKMKEKREEIEKEKEILKNDKFQKIEILSSKSGITFATIKGKISEGIN